MCVLFVAGTNSLNVSDSDQQSAAPATVFDANQSGSFSNNGPQSDDFDCSFKRGGTPSAVVYSTVEIPLKRCILEAALQLLQQGEREYDKKNIIRKDDPAFDQPFKGKMHDWEPSFDDEPPSPFISRSELHTVFDKPEDSSHRRSQQLQPHTSIVRRDGSPPELTSRALSVQNHSQNAAAAERHSASDAVRPTGELPPLPQPPAVDLSETIVSKKNGGPAFSTPVTNRQDISSLTEKFDNMSVITRGTATPKRTDGQLRALRQNHNQSLRSNSSVSTGFVNRLVEVVQRRKSPYVYSTV